VRSGYRRIHSSIKFKRGDKEKDKTPHPLRTSRRPFPTKKIRFIIPRSEISPPGQETFKNPPRGKSPERPSEPRSQPARAYPITRPPGIRWQGRGTSKPALKIVSKRGVMMGTRKKAGTFFFFAI